MNLIKEIVNKCIILTLIFSFNIPVFAQELIPKICLAPKSNVKKLDGKTFRDRMAEKIAKDIDELAKTQVEKGVSEDELNAVENPYNENGELKVEIGEIDEVGMNRLSELGLTENDIQSAEISILNGEFVPQLIYAGAATRLGLGSIFYVDAMDVAENIIKDFDNYRKLKGVDISNEAIMEDVISFFTDKGAKQTQAFLSEYLPFIGNNFYVNQKKDTEKLELLNLIKDEINTYKDIMAKGNQFSLSFGERQLLQLRAYYTSLALKNERDVQEVLANQKLIIHISENNAEEIKQTFVDGDFFGFKPENILFVVQDTFHGFIQDADGKYIENPKSKKYPFGHGYTLMQLNEIQSSQSWNGKEFVTNELSPLDIVSAKGGKLLAANRINDLTKITEDIISSLRVAYASKKIKEGHGVVVELVGNPGKQKGGAWLGWNKGVIGVGERINKFLLETLNASTDMWKKALSELYKNYESKTGKGVPYNKFAQMYDIDNLKSTLTQKGGLPSSLRARGDEGATLEITSGDYTWFPEANAVGFQMVREDENGGIEEDLIHDFKAPKNLMEALNYTKIQDENSLFNQLAYEYNKIKTEAKANSKSFREKMAEKIQKDVTALVEKQTAESLEEDELNAFENPYNENGELKVEIGEIDEVGMNRLSELGLTENDIQSAELSILNGEFVPQLIYAGAATRLGLGSMFYIDAMDIAKNILNDFDNYRKLKGVEISNETIMEDIIAFFTDKGAKQTQAFLSEYLPFIGNNFYVNQKKDTEKLELLNLIKDEINTYKDIMAKGNQFSLSFGERQLLQLVTYYTKLATKFNRDSEAVLAKQKLIIHISENNAEEIKQTFVDGDFFGFKPENILFVVQDTFHGFIQDADGKYIENPKSKKYPFGHGYTLMQLNEKQSSQSWNGKEFVTNELSPLDIVSAKGGKLLAANRINDLTKITDDIISSLRVAYASKKIKEGHGVVVELVGNPTKQKGGAWLGWKKGVKGVGARINKFLLETLNASTNTWKRAFSELYKNYESKTGKGVPYNKFAQMYDIDNLKSTLTQKGGLPSSLRARGDEGATLEITSGDYTWFPEANAVGFQMVREDENGGIEEDLIHDFKAPKNLLESLNFIQKQDADSVFSQLAGKLNHLKRTVDINSKMSQKLIGSRA